MPFGEKQMLRIGTQRICVGPGELKWNEDCQMENGKLRQILPNTVENIDLGANEASWVLDTINVGLGISKVITMNFGGVFKSIPGRSRKALLLWEWDNEYPDIKSPEAKIVLEVSACTGNALRVPVWELFRLSVVKHYVQRVFPNKLPKPDEPTPSFLEAFKNGFEAFESNWKSNNDFYESALVIIRNLLRRLFFTGPTPKGNLLAWIVDKSQNGLLIRNCYQHQWIELLHDSTTDAALAIMSRRCLENDCPNGSKHGIANESLRTALRTILFVEDAVKVEQQNANKKSTHRFGPQKLPPPARQDSEAQEQLSSKLQSLYMGLKKKKLSSGPASESTTPTVLTAVTVPPLPFRQDDGPAASQHLPAHLCEPAVTATIGSNTMNTTSGSENQEPILALVTCSTTYKKLQMQKILPPPQTQIYVISLQPSHSKMIIPWGGARHKAHYRELTGDLEEYQHPVEAWIM